MKRNLHFLSKTTLAKIGMATVFSLCACATSHAAVISSGLVAEYTFDSGNANNTGPLGTDGADVGSPVYSMVAGRQALTVSDGNYVQVAADPDVYSGNEARTVAMWLNVGAFTDNTSPFRSGITGTAGDDFSIELETDGQWTLNRWGGDIEENAAGPVGEWHHIALTFDGVDQFTSYIDGVVSKTVTSTFNTPEGILRFGGPRIGKPSEAGDADLSVDDILIYNRALSASEVQMIVAIPELSTSMLALIATSLVLLLRRRR
ncbi:LamG domain-containing protein [Kiritimatiellota bacterium B12222]|nr:LamG domain-containing protein [Kiritimatiellota bacterium B12222]